MQQTARPPRGEPRRLPPLSTGRITCVKRLHLTSRSPAASSNSHSTAALGRMMSVPVAHDVQVFECAEAQAHGSAATMCINSTLIAAVP